MIINIQGTGGSGKSTIVKAIAGLYEKHTDEFIEGRRQPIYTVHESPGRTPLFIPGHYNIACGGCDTISSTDTVYALVKEAASKGMDVLFEGIMCQDRALGTIELHKMYPGHVFVVALNVPLADCLASIQQRRDARGDIRPLNPRRTTDRDRSLKTRVSRLRNNSVDVKWWNREEALAYVKGLLGWGGDK